MENDTKAERDTIAVEVAYALPDKQKIISLQVPGDCTVYQAAQRSQIASEFSQIDLDSAKMGIFGKVVPKPKEHTLRAGDRVEIYRPLKIDPKQSRKARAAKAKQRTEAPAKAASGDLDT